MTEEHGQAPEEELPDDPAEEGEVGPDGTTDEAPETEQNGGLEKALKDTKATLTREQQEKAAMRRELDELRGQVTAITAMKGSQKEAEQAKDAFGEKLRNPEFLEKLLDEPQTLADVLLESRATTKAEVGQVMREWIDYFKSELERRDPKIVEKREQIDELRKKAEFANLPDSTLAAIVEMAPSKKPREPERARGTMGGGRTMKTHTDTEFENMVKKFDNMMGFDKIEIPKEKKND